MKNLFLPFLLCAFCTPVFAANFTANVTGNWNDDATWVGTGVPGASDNVTINNGVTVTITVNQSVTNVTIGDGITAGNAILRVNDGITFTVSGTFTYLDNLDTGSEVFDLVGSANATITGNITFDGGSTESRLRFVTTPTGTLTLNGSVAGSGSIAGGSSGATINFGSTTISQTIPVSGTAYVYDNITVSNTTAGGAVLQANIGTTQLNGNFTIATGGRFDMEDKTLAGNTLKTFQISSGGTLEISVAAVSFPSGFGTITLTGTVEYSFAGAQTISDQDYGNLTLSGSGAKTLPATSTVTATGTLTINGTATLDMNTNAEDISILSLADNHAADGITESTTNSITFTGTSAATIDVTGAVDYGDVIFSNTVGTRINSNGTSLLFNDVTISATGIFDPDAINFTIDGNWTNNNGTAGFIPSAGQQVTFSSSTTLTGTTSFAAILISATGTLIAPAGNTNVSGTWDNDGIFTHSSGTVTFNGPAVAQSIAAGNKTTFYNWTLNNSAGVTLNAAVDIATGGTLTLTSGTITINGQTLTLLSTGPSSAASIAAIPGGGADGGITGDFTFQRYVGGGSGWRIMYSPVGGNGGAGGDGTIEGWNDDFQMSNFPGSDDPTYGWTSVYYYDETDITGDLNNGYTIPVSSNARVDSGKAIFAYIGPSGVTLDQTGSLTKGNQALSASYSNSGTPANDGWNLIGNPYPSDINWKLVGFTGGVDDKAYIYDDAGGYLPAIDASTCISPCPIASNIGFWVQTIGSAGTVTFHETDKVASGGTFYKLGPGELEQLFLTINAPNGTYNKTEFQFIDGATPAFDAFIDAYKLYTFNWQGVDIYTQSSDSQKLSTNCWPDTNQSISIPVFVKNRITGTHSITADLANIPSDKCVYLEDLSDSSIYDLRANATISFSFPVTTDANRFMLHIGAPAIATVNNPTCTNDTDGFATVGGVTPGPWTLEWYFVDGTDSTLIRTASNISVPDTLKNAAAGTYAVKIIDASSLCGSVTKSIVIFQPEPITALVTKTNLLCYGDSSGTIEITPSGGNDSIAVLWSNSSTDTMQTGLASGTYSVTMTDSKGCTGTQVVLISEPAILLASITKTDITCNGTSDGTAAAAAAGGSSPYSYQWSNGSTVSGIQNLTSGIYSVTVTDSSNCTALDSTTIIEPLLLIATATDITCNGNSNGTATAAAAGGSSPYSYQWSNGNTVSGIQNLTSGIYSVTVTDSSTCTAVDSATISEPSAISTTITSTDAICNGSSDGSATLAVSGGIAPYTYNWSNGLIAPIIFGLSSGNYQVTVTDSSICVKNDSVAINEPAALFISHTKNDPTCYGYTNGTIDITASGGTIPYDYLWSDSIVTQDRINLGAGFYSVSVTDMNSCENSHAITLVDPAEVTAGFIPSDDTVIFNFGGSLFFTNTSVNAVNYFWDFGDGNTATGVDPVHTYSSVGNYMVTLTASDPNNCTGVFSMQIVVEELVNIPVRQSKKVTISRTGKFISINLNNKFTVSPDIILMNALGQTVIIPVPDEGENLIKINTEDLNRGVYFIRILGVEGSVTEKFIN